MKRLLLWIIGAAICVAAGMAAQRSLHLWVPRDADQAPTHSRTVISEDGRRLVAALGRLEPEGGVIDVGIGSGIPDRLDRLLVSEGQQVKAGQELAYLESYWPRAVEKEYVASQLAEAKARLASESAYWHAQVEEAKLALDSSGKLSPLDLEAQEATVRLQEAECAHAEQEVKRSAELKKSDASTQQDLDHQNLLLRRRREALCSAQVQLRRLQTARQLDLARTRAQVATAEAALARARDALPVASLEKSLRLAEERLKLAVIRAPCSGTILNVRTHPGEAVGAKPILRMGRTQAMLAVAEVYYTELRFVKLGQKATITSPALPQTLQGTVVLVGSLIGKKDVLGIDPTAEVDARVIEVRIRLEPDELASRLTYLQVDVQIGIEEEKAR
jgi:HlyD family secretion protein